MLSHAEGTTKPSHLWCGCGSGIPGKAFSDETHCRNRTPSEGHEGPPCSRVLAWPPPKQLHRSWRLPVHAVTLRTRRDQETPRWPPIELRALIPVVRAPLAPCQSFRVDAADSRDLPWFGDFFRRAKYLRVSKSAALSVFSLTPSVMTGGHQVRRAARASTKENRRSFEVPQLGALFLSNLQNCRVRFFIAVRTRFAALKGARVAFGWGGRETTKQQHRATARTLLCRNIRSMCQL